MALTRRDFIKKSGIMAIGAAVASVIPLSLLPKTKLPSTAVHQFVFNRECHLEAPICFDKRHLKVYRNDVLQVHNKDYRTDTPDWMNRSVVTLHAEKGDRILIIREPIWFT